MDEIQVVAFRLGQEEYAVDILAVQEIIKITQVTRVPKAPRFVQGVINLRGNVVPLINLRSRFELEQKENSSSSRFIILNINDHRIGITVDSVTEVARISQDNIEDSVSLENIDKDFVKGIGKHNGRLLIMLKLEEIIRLATE